VRAVGRFGNWSNGSHVVQGLGYAARVEVCERVIDDLSGAEVALSGLQG